MTLFYFMPSGLGSLLAQDGDEEEQEQRQEHDDKDEDYPPPNRAVHFRH